MLLKLPSIFLDPALRGLLPSCSTHSHNVNDCQDAINLIITIAQRDVDLLVGVIDLAGIFI
jgi:hypothetical protein